MNRKTYKRIKKAIEIAKLIMVLGIISVFLFALAYINTHYSREGFVTPTEIKNEYSFKDITGEEWLFYTDEDIKPHTRIHAKMFNNCTEHYIKDDMIIDYVKLDVE